MIDLLGIEVGNCWGCVVGDVPVKHVGEHFLGEDVVEFLNLFLKITQEGVPEPVTNHHDEENRTTPPRNITIAAPEQMECVSISLADMWRVPLSLIVETASCNALVMCLDVMCLMGLYFQMAETGVFLLAPGYDWILQTMMAAATLTGHNVSTLPDAI